MKNLQKKLNNIRHKLLESKRISDLQIKDLEFIRDLTNTDLEVILDYNKESLLKILKENSTLCKRDLYIKYYMGRGLQIRKGPSRILKTPN